MRALISKGEWTPEIRLRWEKMDSEQKLLDAKIRSEELALELRQFRPPPQGQPGRDSGHEIRITDRATELRSRPEYANAFDLYCRTGKVSESLESLRSYSPLDEGTSSGSGAGYTIPIGFQKELEVKLKALGGMRRNCRILNTATGNVLQWPTLDDTANAGEWLPINSAVGQANPAFGQVAFTPQLASSKQVLVPVQLLQDSAFDLQSELSDAFAIRLGRLTNAGYTIETSHNGLPYLSFSFLRKSNVLTCAVNFALGRYAGSSAFMRFARSSVPIELRSVFPLVFVSPTAITAFVIAGMSPPGWPFEVPVSFVAGVPDKIFGYEWDWNADMAAIGAGNKSVVFGLFSKYVIRDVVGVVLVRFNELYMPQ